MSSQPEQPTAFDLMVAKFESYKASMLRDLNRSIFEDVYAAPLTPLTRRERLALTWARVRRYGSTLWDALRGRDPHDWDVH